MAKNKSHTDFYYVAGLDIGNGYVKGVIGLSENAEAVIKHDTVFDNTDAVPGDVIDMPSMAAVLTKSTYLPTPNEQAPAVTGVAPHTVNDTADALDFFNSVMCMYSSPMIPRGDRHVVGARALTADGYIDDFAVTGSTASKADQVLSKTLVLSLIAAKAVKDYVGAIGHLPGSTPDDSNNHLTVHATVALALPIGEYVAKRHEYAAAFTGAGNTTEGSDIGHLTHVVTVTNFVTPVTVSIIFDKVIVLAEGASAQYAISQYGEPLAAAMLNQVRSRETTPGEIIDPEITAADIFAASNTVGIDIGEGTVNFPVFTGGKFNTDTSTTYSEGYGTVLERALEDMASENIYTFSSRKQLADFLIKEPSAMKRKAYAQVKMYVDKQIEFFVEDVAAHFGRVLATVGAATEVVYVYGGGSGPVYEALYPRLVAKVNEMTSFGGFPVLYLDAKYSRGLNREGLYLAAKVARK